MVCFWFNNLVLDGDFYSLGKKWSLAPRGQTIEPNHFTDNTDAMNKAEFLYRIFPRRAECKVIYGGGGGGVNKMHFYCILAPNVLSQYVFLILWFWYAALLFINGLNLLRNLLMVLKVGTIRNVYLMKVVGSTKVNSINYILNWYSNFVK